MIPVQFEDFQKSDGSKILPSIHKIPARFERGRKLTVTNSFQSPLELVAKEMYFNRPVSFLKRQKFSVFIICKCAHDAVL